ncbi:MAG: lipid kinase [Deltaproteobacteria bacterium]|nr:lipid kinase [Deltaproteobacteria bacterium]
MSNETELQEEISRERRAVLVVNARSRAGARFFSRAVEILTDRGIRLEEVHGLKDPARLPEIVGRAADRGIRLVIAGGGDGTMTSVVGPLAYRDAVLGVLPLGTGNAFARSLGIPLDLEGAVDVLVHGDVAAVDLGKVNRKYFANVASIGVTTAVARRISAVTKRWLGPIAYAIVGARVLLSLRPFRCRVQADDKRFEVDTRQLVLANGRFFGIGVVAPGAHVDDRLLTVFTVGEESRLEYVKVWTAFLLGRNSLLTGSNYLSSRVVDVETDPPQHVNADGEAVGRTPARFEVAPEALKVLVPTGFRDRRRASSPA